MLVAYREETNIIKTLTNAEALLEVKGDPDDILEAANHVDDGMTPFDAVHLVKSKDDPIVSCDSSYDKYSERIN